MKAMGAFLMIFGFLSTGPEGFHGTAIFVMALGALLLYAGAKLGQ